MEKFQQISKARQCSPTYVSNEQEILPLFTIQSQKASIITT